MLNHIQQVVFLLSFGLDELLNLSDSIKKLEVDKSAKITRLRRMISNLSFLLRLVPS